MPEPANPNRISRELAEAVIYGRCCLCGAPKTIVGKSVPLPTPDGVRVTSVLLWRCSQDETHICAS